MKSISELEAISPFIVNVSLYDNIIGNKVGNTIANMDWIHLTKKNLIKSEYKLLCYEARQCCTYDEEREVYDMDLYWCAIYEDVPTLPTWWNSIIELLEEGKYGTTQIQVNIESDAYSKVDGSSVPSEDDKLHISNPLDNLYIERYSKEVQKLDILIRLDWTILATLQKCFPVPFLGTSKDITRRMCGAIDEDEAWFKNIMKNVEAYLVDPSIAWHTFGPLQNEPCLQDIVFHGCPTHDQMTQQEFTYSYKINDITIVCKVSKIASDPNKCILIFTTSTKLIDSGLYIAWNNSISEGLLKCIDHISDGSVYNTKRHLQYGDE